MNEYTVGWHRTSTINRRRKRCSRACKLARIKAAAFEGGLVEGLNAGALSLIASAGRRKDLFNSMAWTLGRYPERVQ
jgi:hypothetical protein